MISPRKCRHLKSWSWESLQKHNLPYLAHKDAERVFAAGRSSAGRSTEGALYNRSSSSRRSAPGGPAVAANSHGRSPPGLPTTETPRPRPSQAIAGGVSSHLDLIARRRNPHDGDGRVVIPTQHDVPARSSYKCSNRVDPSDDSIPRSPAWRRKARDPGGAWRSSGFAAAWACAFPTFIRPACVSGGAGGPIHS